MLIRANEHAAGGEDLDLFHALKPVFENIAMAKVSTSAEEAREIGFLRRGDLVSMNRDRLVADAKETALGLVRAGYHPPAPTSRRFACWARNSSPAPSSPLHMMLRGEFISEYDALVGAQARQRARRRRAHRAATRQRAIPPRSRARSLRQPLRRTQNPGAHRPHPENRQAPAQLAFGAAGFTDRGKKAQPLSSRAPLGVMDLHMHLHSLCSWRSYFAFASVFAVSSI